MGNVLPAETGLTVNGVLYRYTVVKETSDNMLVHVQNKDATGTGLIFRETDDWSQLPANTINKMVAVDNVPISRWGDGSIEIEGRGEVVNPTVIYTYKIDTCFDPQSSPTCAGYEPPVPSVSEPVIDVYNALDDEYVKSANKQTNAETYEKEEKIADKKEKEEKDNNKKEKALAIVDSALGMANAVAENNMLQAMVIATDINQYYAVSINGGVYKETVVLRDKKLPDNRGALRNNFAQQVLHNKMIDMQYRR